jgi:hypothetical protein
LGRSAAYWATNLYPDARLEPKPSAPYRDLPVLESGRFRQLRDGLQKVSGVAEHVRFLGPTWKWTWEYAMGQRRLCWLHAMQGSVSATFTLTIDEESKALRLKQLASPVKSAILYGQRTGPVRWCWIEFTDRKMSDGFLGFMKRKGEWMAAEMVPPGRKKAAS